jgi:hypothetical protein
MRQSALETRNLQERTKYGVYKVACVLKAPKINTGRGMEAKRSTVEEVTPKINYC